MGKTNIEWTEATWNPVAGCSKVSPGCTHCYAETMAKLIRAAALALPETARTDVQRAYIDVVDDRGRWTGTMVPLPSRLMEPLRWRKPRMVFVNSMSDLFHPDVPDLFIAAVFGVMAACPQQTFQVLTKRPKRAREWFEWVLRDLTERQRDVVQAPNTPCAVIDAAFTLMGEVPAAKSQLDPHWIRHRENGGPWPLPNVWIGTSVENQGAADERIPILLQIPAAVRFLSCEPLIGPVDLHHVQYDHTIEYDALRGTMGVYRPHRGKCPRVDWVIVGGESGPNARPCNVAWVRGIVEQCKAAATACFVKQLGKYPMLSLREDAIGDHPTFEGAPSSARAWNRGDYGDRLSIGDPKGGDPAEWPEDLRVREFPEGGGQ